MNDFQDKVIWITGASSGFGEALACALAALGAKIILSARRGDELERVRNRIGANAAVLPLDMMRNSEFREKTAEAIALFGHVDTIVHNAGIAQRSAALVTEQSVERTIMEVDFFSYAELTRCLLPHFIERKSGHIVVVSGALAKIFLPMRTTYCAAKAALHGYFGSLRSEVARHGVDVTILVPGLMQTDLVRGALDGAGKPLGDTPPGGGCPPDEAARQAVSAIAARTFETYIGKNDKVRLMMLLARLFPDRLARMILKQAASS